MKLPTAAELERAAAAFDEDWGRVDEVLYGICRQYPGHGVRREVTAKVALIDRAYSAGLERQVVPDAGDQAITKIATFLVAQGGEVDEILANLAPLREPLDEETMTEIVAVHGRFTDLLRGIPTRGTAPRSFAAKYLHFHRAVVPIYDSYAATRLVTLVPWKEVERPFTEPPGADAEYWYFCVRFLELYQACRQAVPSVSVKSLDSYIWTVPTSGQGVGPSSAEG